jgi:hypothetical protein
MTSVSLCLSLAYVMPEFAVVSIRQSAAIIRAAHIFVKITAALPRWF